MATLGEIADKAGVSVSTVSYVLAGKGEQKRISEQVVHRVMQAAQHLRYKPHSAARSLLRKSAEQVGVLLRHSLDHPYHNPPLIEFITGVNLHLEAADYVVSIVRLEDVPVDGGMPSRVFREQMLDGVIVCDDVPDPVREEVLRLSDACIWANNSSYVKHGCIRRDERHTGRLIGEKLVQAGYRRVVWQGLNPAPAVAEFTSHYSVIDRREGLLEVVQKNGLEWETMAVTVATSQDTLIGAIKKLKSPDTAFVMYDTFGALRLASAVATAGFRVGTDFGVACCDDWEMVTMSWPELSRVSYDLIDMGRQAAQMLLDVIAEPGKPVTSRQLRGEWFAGSTLRQG